MTRSKKVFLIIAAIFLIIVAIVAYDFSRKTTFPGKRSHAIGGQSHSSGNPVDSWLIS